MSAFVLLKSECAGIASVDANRAFQSLSGVQDPKQFVDQVTSAQTIHSRNIVAALPLELVECFEQLIEQVPVMGSTIGISGARISPAHGDVAILCLATVGAGFCAKAGTGRIQAYRPTKAAPCRRSVRKHVGFIHPTQAGPSEPTALNRRRSSRYSPVPKGAERQVNTTDKATTIDRQALAQQVIISCGNILAAAGFGRAEIADFFTQAADQLRGGAAEKKSPAVEDRLARVATEFSQNTAVHELHSLGMKAQALMPLEPDAPDLRDAFDMAMQAVPLLAEAQQGLRTMASEAGLPLVARRTERDSMAASADPRGAGQVVCLEDFEALYQGAFDILGAVAEALLQRHDRDAFTFLLAHLADNGVILTPRLQATIEKATYSLEG
jgi:hypothetical protein